MGFFVKIVDGAIDWASLDSKQEFSQPVDGEPSVPVSFELPEGEDHEWLEPAQDGLSIVVNETKKKQRLNKRAFDAFVTERKAQASAAGDALIAGKDADIQLAEIMAVLFEYVQGVESLCAGSLPAEAQAAKDILLGVKTGLWAQLAEIHGQADADILAYTPPHSDVEPLFPVE